MKKPHIMIIEGRFYDNIADMLLKGAVQALDLQGATYEHFTVPGALEIPAAVRLGGRRAKGQSFDGFVALGCVLRGETTHYDTVCQESARALTDLAAHYNLLIGNGILTCETEEQAIERADPTKGNKGGDAVRALFALLDLRDHFGVKK